MVQATNFDFSIARTASARLKAAQAEEPHPLYPRPGDVVRYVSDLQMADTALARSINASRGDTLQLAEVALLRRKRTIIDASIARQVMLAARRMGSRRQESIATLNAIFKMGIEPDPPLNGPYRGQLVTTTRSPLLDSFVRISSRAWIPWHGKEFRAGSSSGDNIVTPSLPRLTRFLWPTFHGFSPYGEGLLTAFTFHTSTGPGLHDPEVTALKLDYNLPSNPGRVRMVLDEVVQVSGNYYLGKAYTRLPNGKDQLEAFFSLARER